MTSFKVDIPVEIIVGNFFLAIWICKGRLVNSPEPTLKTFIFTKADLDLYESPINLKYELEPKEQLLALQKCELNEDDQEIISNYLADYKAKEDIDRRVVRRQEDASDAISKIIVGLPVYLYHWSVITRDRRRRKDNV